MKIRKTLGLIGIVGITSTSVLAALNAKRYNLSADSTGTQYSITLTSSNFEFGSYGYNSYYFNIVAKTAVTETNFIYGENNYLEAENISFDGCIFEAYSEGYEPFAPVIFTMCFDVYSPTGEPSVTLNGSFDFSWNPLTYKGAKESENRYHFSISLNDYINVFLESVVISYYC